MNVRKGDCVKVKGLDHIYRVTRIRSGHVYLLRLGADETEALKYPDVYYCPIRRVDHDFFTNAVTRRRQRTKRIKKEIQT